MKPSQPPLPLVEVRGLEVQFPVRHGGRQAKIQAVAGVDLEIAPGEVLGLVGESGSGKTTVGRALLRLVSPQAGDIRYDGQTVSLLPNREFARLRPQIQMVFQDPTASLNPWMTVGEILKEPLSVDRTWTSQRRRDRVRELLGWVHLDENYLTRHPHQLSGGQKQRVAIARALATGPRLLVADEPVSSLDVSVQAQVINLLGELRQRTDLTMLFISHDLAVVHHFADRVAVMYLGRVVESAPSGPLFRHPRHPYTQMLLASIPNPDPSVKRPSHAVVGEVPSPLSPPSGCGFRTRCPLAGPVCAAQVPPLRPWASGHSVACHKEFP